MKKKLLVMSHSTVNTYNNTRLVEEGKKRDLEVVHHEYTESFVRMDSNKVSFTFSDGSSALDFDYYIFRSAKRKDGYNYAFFAHCLRYILKEKSEYILNYENAVRFRSEATKIFNYVILASNGIPVISSQVFGSNDRFDLEKSGLIFPLIAKSSNKSLGKGIFLMSEESELDELFGRQEISGFLVQDFLNDFEKEKWDVRIVVVGKKVLGAYKRVTSSENLTTNMHSGAIAQPFHLSDELKAIALRCAEVLHFEFCGIDIMFDNGKPFVLEVNSSPQFEGFESITQLNVAGEILDFMMAKK